MTKRCLLYVPEVFKGGSFKKEEGLRRLALSTESVSTESLRVAQGNMEAVLRRVLNDVVFRTVEKGTVRIDAAAMQSALRRYQSGIHFTAVLPPVGIVRHAQIASVLGASKADEEGMSDEKDENRVLLAQQKAIAKDVEKRKQLFQQRKAEKAAAAAEATAA